MANLSNINGKFVVEQTTGYVGVGTTDPNYPIEVLNASAEIALNASGGSIYRVQSDSASNFIIRKAGVGDRLVINSAGNSTFSGSVTGTLARFDTLNNNANSANIIYRSGTNTIVGNNASALVVQDSGNVGIGFSNPSELLHILGSNATALIQGSGTSSTAGVDFFPRDASNVAHLQSIKGVDSNLTFLTGGNSGNSYVPTQRMRIDSGGSVIIGDGTTSGTPTGDYRSLEIGRQGNTITGAPWKSNLYFSTNATITAGSTAFTYRYASELPTKMIMEDGFWTFSNAVAGTVGSTISFTERMRIDSSGNVSLNGGILGLGNASSTPTIGYGMFHYSGVGLGIYSSAGGGTQGIGFWLNNGSAYEAGRWLSNGNFGIGITNPQDKLHVNGDAIISSTRFGDFAVGSLNTTGYAIANVAASTNGQSAIVEFVASGNNGGYYNVVYSCYNGGGAWYYTKNVVGSGGNIEVAETNGGGSSTLVFYFRATSGGASYTPRVMMKGMPYNLVTF